MRRNLADYPTGPQRFQNAIRSAAGLSAVIRQTEYGLLIQMSDGRMCSLARELCGPSDSAMSAAMQWARRNGATSVEIRD